MLRRSDVAFSLSGNFTTQLEAIGRKAEFWRKAPAQMITGLHGLGIEGWFGAIGDSTSQT
jgi:hypothetical protein